MNTMLEVQFFLIFFFNFQHRVHLFKKMSLTMKFYCEIY